MAPQVKHNPSTIMLILLEETNPDQRHGQNPTNITTNVRQPIM